MAPKPLSHTLAKTVRAAVVFFFHVGLGMVIATGIWLSEKYFSALYSQHEPMLFDRLPLKYLFHTADVVVMLLFIFWGAVEANQRFRGK